MRSGRLDRSSLFGCLQRAGFQATDLGQTASPSAIQQFTSASADQDDGVTVLSWKANDIQLVTSGRTAIAMLGVFESAAAAASHVAGIAEANHARAQEGLAPLTPEMAARNVVVLALADQAQIERAVVDC